MYGVKKTHTTPHHPQGNPHCEGFNRTLHNLLCTFPPEKKRRWPEHLSELLYAYNVMPHSTTGYSPYYLRFGVHPRYLLFGVHPHLPVDALLGREEVKDDKLDWLAVHQERLQDAHARAREFAERKAAQRVVQQQGKVSCHAWAAPVYKVVHIQGTTYIVVPLEGGPVKRVHRSNLGPCVGSIPAPKLRLHDQEVSSVDEHQESDTEFEHPRFVLMEEVQYPAEWSATRQPRNLVPKVDEPGNQLEDGTENLVEGEDLLRQESSNNSDDHEVEPIAYPPPGPRSIGFSREESVVKTCSSS